LTADGVRELIATLQSDSLTADVFGDGVTAIVEAINRIIDAPPDYIDLPPQAGDGGKMARSTDDGEVVQLLRSIDERLRVLEAVEDNTGTAAAAQREIATELRRSVVREASVESRLSPRRKPVMP
jgi:hypothetical protein